MRMVDARGVENYTVDMEWNHRQDLADDDREIDGWAVRFGRNGSSTNYLIKM